MWKKKKRRYSRLVILDSKNDTTKKIKKILSEKHRCVLRVIELKNNKQGNPSQAAIMSYVSDIKETQENEIRKKI
jgi:hypothetical protein